jgi:hypothetical protein
MTIATPDPPHLSLPFQDKLDQLKNWLLSKMAYTPNIDESEMGEDVNQVDSIVRRDDDASAPIQQKISLTMYSKKQREVFQEIEQLVADYYSHHSSITRQPLKQATQDTNKEEENLSNDSMPLFTANFSVYETFLRQWTAMVPELMALANAPSKVNNNSTKLLQQSQMDEDVLLPQQSVEQDGCPEESDLNRWSHHQSVLTCDDELMGKALGDADDLVSFVFGLEINWSLLEQRELIMRDENERRKEQQVKDLAELNEKRRRLKEKKKKGEDFEIASESNDEDDSMIVDEIKAKKVNMPQEKQDKHKKKEKSKSNCKSKEGKPTKLKKGREEMEVEMLDEDDDEHRIAEEEHFESESDLNLNNVQLHFESESYADPIQTTVDESKDRKSKKKDKAHKKERSNTTGDANPLTTPIVNDPQTNISLMTSPAQTSMTMTPVLVDAATCNDSLFEEDRKRLHKVISKMKIDHFQNFDVFWKILKRINNNWRVNYDAENREIFMRTPGCKVDTLHQFSVTEDYFVEVEGLLTFILRQCQLNKDEILEKLLTPLYLVAVASYHKLQQQQQPQPQQKENAMIVDEEEIYFSMQPAREGQVKLTAKGQRAAILTALEEDDDDGLVILTNSPAVTHKNRSDPNSLSEVTSKNNNIKNKRIAVDLNSSDDSSIDHHREKRKKIVLEDLSISPAITSKLSSNNNNNHLNSANKKKVHFGDENQFPSNSSDTVIELISPSQSSQLELRDKNMWSCKNCTLLNDDYRTHCSSCKQRRFGSSRLAKNALLASQSFG